MYHSNVNKISKKLQVVLTHSNCHSRLFQEKTLYITLYIRIKLVNTEGPSAADKTDILTGSWQRLEKELKDS